MSAATPKTTAPWQHVLFGTPERPVVHNQSDSPLTREGKFDVSMRRTVLYKRVGFPVSEGAFKRISSSTISDAFYFPKEREEGTLDAASAQELGQYRQSLTVKLNADKPVEIIRNGDGVYLSIRVNEARHPIQVWANDNEADKLLGVIEKFIGISVRRREIMGISLMLQRVPLPYHDGESTYRHRIRIGDDGRISLMVKDETHAEFESWVNFRTKLLRNTRQNALD